MYTFTLKVISLMYEDQIYLDAIATDGTVLQFNVVNSQCSNPLLIRNDVNYILITYEIVNFFSLLDFRA